MMVLCFYRGAASYLTCVINAGFTRFLDFSGGWLAMKPDIGLN